MPTKILLITPPFTQLNTPYPATPYLKGFLKLHGYDVFQADLGIELIHKIFSREGFERLFDTVKKSNKPLSDNSRLIVENERFYLQTIESVMQFLSIATTRLPGFCVPIIFCRRLPASITFLTWTGPSGAAECRIKPGFWQRGTSRTSAILSRTQ